MSQNKQLDQLSSKLDTLIDLFGSKVVATPAKGRRVSASGIVGSIKPVKKAKASTPAWIVEKAQNKAARRDLAKKLRDQGIEPQGAAWKKAKKQAGLA